MRGQRLLLGEVSRLAHHLQGVAHRERPVGRDAVGERECAVEDLGARHDAVDETELSARRGVDRVTGDRELGRDRERDPLRQPDEPTGGGEEARA